MLGPILLLALIPPQAEAPPSARERLEALIESTNRLEHFSAEYALERDGKAIRVLIDYVAPRSFRMCIWAPGGESYMGCVDDVFWMTTRTLESPRRASRAKLDLLDREGELESALAVLEEDFWSAGDGPRVNVVMTWGFDQETDKTALEFSISAPTLGKIERHPLLGWLSTMQTLGGDLVIEGDELVHRSERASAHVDVATGFLTKLIVTSGEGLDQTIELVSLDLETQPQSSTFEELSAEADAEDLTDDVRARILTRDLVRSVALKHVHGLLKRGEEDWDEDVRHEIRRLAAALYEPYIARMLGGWVEQRRAYWLEFADGLRKDLESGVSREDLLAKAEEQRGLLVEELASGRSRILSNVPADSTELAGEADWLRIRALEDEVLGGVFDALVGGPVFESFDEAIASALGE
jgi:hypothetical protein